MLIQICEECGGETTTLRSVLVEGCPKRLCPTCAMRINNESNPYPGNLLNG